MTSSIVSGSFVSTGVPITIPMSMGIDGIFLFNRSQMSSTATPAVVKKAMWLSSMAAGSAFLTKNTAGAATDESSIITTNGFTIVDDSNPATFPAVALGAPFYTQANPVVWTTATPHGFSVGDMVRVYSLTGAMQYSGIAFTVSAVGSSTTFSTLLNTTGIPIPTAGFVRKIAGNTSLYVPSRLTITKMASSGTSTVVTTATTHNYKVGQKVVFTVPTVTSLAFNFGAMNGLVGTITAVNTTVTVNSFTVDIDSSSFGTFTFPLTSNIPFTFAQVTPYSDGQPNPLPIPAPDSNVFVGARDNVATRGIYVGSSILTGAADTWDYYAFSSAQIINP